MIIFTTTVTTVYDRRGEDPKEQYLSLLDGEPK